MGIVETAKKVSKLKGTLPPTRIQSPGKIASIIETLIEEAQPLEITIDIRTTTFYSNRVYKAKSFKGYPSLEIDTVFPINIAMHAFQDSRLIEIGFRLEGNPYTFKSSFFAMDDESSLVTIAYPKIIYLHMFRTAERFYITLEAPLVFVNIKYFATKKTAGLEVGLVKNISMDGLAFTTNDRMLAPGKEIKVEIEISGSDFISTKAVIKNLNFINGKEFKYVCGICFDDLNMWQKRIISTLIQELKKSRAKFDDDTYDRERINKIAIAKAKIKARLEGRDFKEELEDIKDLLEFEKIDLDESLDL